MRLTRRFSLPALKGLLLAGAFLAVMPPSEASAWWNSQWRARKKLFFKNLNQGQLDSFPVLVVFNSSRIDYTRTQNAGQDIRFVDADDSTALPYEIEKWNETGNSYVWVGVPTINAGSTTDFIYVYYDNPSAVDAQNRVNVWVPASYTLVYHLNEPSGQHQDSTTPPPPGSPRTSYDISVTSQGSAGAGQIDGADVFGGGSQHIYTASAANLQPGPGEAMTLEAWAKPTLGAWQVVISKEVTFSCPSQPTEREYQLWFQGTGEPVFWAHQGDGGCIAGYPVQVQGAAVGNATFHYLVGTWDGTSSTIALWVDGGLIGSQQNTNITQLDTAADFTIGQEGDTDHGGSFNGVIDEVRVSKIVRTPDWIKAQNLSMTDNFIAFGPEILKCCALTTAIEDIGTTRYDLRVTGSSGFELHFDKRRGGGITRFYDLEEDPLKNNDLAGGDDNYPTLFYDSLQQNSADPEDSIAWWTWTAGYPLAALPAAPPLAGDTWDLLEATATRVKVRQTSLYQKSCGDAGCPVTAGKVFSAITAQGDYTIYPAGRLGLRWERKTTAPVTFNDHDMDWVVHSDVSAPFDNWTAASQTNGPMPPAANGPGSDDFILIRSETAGARTDFLPILAADWTQAVHTWWWTTDPPDGTENAGSAAWGDDDGTVNASYTGTTVNFLTYFRPKDLNLYTDTAVTRRRDDYRNPAALSIPVGWGTHWNDAAENTAADDYNESEGAYLMNIDPTKGLVFDISPYGVTSADRFQPFFKIRQWRSINDPTAVMLEGTQLKNDQDYVADVKPVSRAYHARDLRYHSTLKDNNAVTTPDVGNAGTVSVAGYPTGRAGNGASIATSAQFVGFNLADFDPLRGAVEFWFLPSYDSYDGVYHDVAGFVRDANNMFLIEKRANNDLAFKIVVQPGGAANTSDLVIPAGVGFPPSNSLKDPFWRTGVWTHIRIEWDESLPAAQQQAIYLNGRKLTPAGTPNDYVGASLLLPSAPNDYFLFGNTNGDASFSAGVYDEIRSYGGLAESGATPKWLANGGLASDSTNEYLNSATSNRQLTFTAIDPQKRGSYLYFGADSKMRGLNFSFAPPGTAGGIPPVLQWEYWNGSTESWASIGSLTDGTNAFTKNGAVFWTADPANWALYSVNGSPDLYYVRVKLTSGGWSTPATESIVRTDILLLQYCGNVSTNNMTFSVGTEAATAVGLLSFSARGLDGGVDLEWATGSETDNAGFHLYRSTSEAGSYVRLTSTMIAGLGSSPAGASYSYRDSGLQNGVTYYYKLEDVETTGATKMHGPVSATPAPGAGGGPDPGGQGGDPGDGSGAGSGSGSGGSQTGGSREGARVAYGEPGAVSVRVLQKNARSAVIELETGGFYATRLASGDYRIEVPGFDATPAPGLPGVPLKQVYVQATAGLGVKLERETATDVIAYAGLRPQDAEAPAMVVADDGTVHAGETAVESAEGSPDLYPSRASRLVQVTFQGETKKALLELAPLQWDANSGSLLLARKLRVELKFDGREAHEVVLSSRRGRRYQDKAGFAVRDVVAYLSVSQRGLQVVRFKDLFEEKAPAIPVSNLRLTRLGDPVAVHVEPDGGNFGRGSLLYFWSEGPSLNPYATVVTYELQVVPSAGVSMPVSDATLSGSPQPSGVTTARFETNRLYQGALVEAGTADLWFWDSVIAPARKSYSFVLGPVAASGEPSWIRVWLQGGTNQEVSPDHHLVAYVDGTWAGEARWDGKQAQVLVGELTPGLLHEGENTLELHNVGDTGATVSSVYLDRFEVSFPRPLLAEAAETEIDVAFASGGRAEIAGLAASSLVLDTTAATPRWLRGVAWSFAGVGFAVEGGHRYLAVAPAGLRHPAVRRPSASTLKSPDNRADYLVIGPRAFLPALRPLVKLRRSEGLVVRTVAVEDLFDEFGFGEARPEALREFVEYAYQHWQPPSVRYVLLVGDATYDPKNYLGAGSTNLVPPYMVKTSYLWTVSDPAIASVNGEDLLPDLAIGRLPAANVDEAQAMAEKIVSWERAGNTLSGLAVLVADNGDQGGDFEGDSEDLAVQALSGRPVERIYLAERGAETRDAIRSAFDRGPGLVSYVGHGAVHLWAGENIFNISDVASLSPQSQQPLVMTMNCLNGYFLFPPFNSLGEELLKAPDKGAIAVLAPTGLSLNDAAHKYQQAFLRELGSGRHARLGDALLAAQASYTDAGGLAELLGIYHLLGDPALDLR